MTSGNITYSTTRGVCVNAILGVIALARQTAWRARCVRKHINNNMTHRDRNVAIKPFWYAVAW